MKNLICLILAAIIIVSCCGCFGGNNSEDVRGSITSANNQSANSQETDAEFSLGKTANNTYTNEFLGLGCTLPSDWEFYTEEQILELNNYMGSLVDEEIAEQLKSADIVYDMYASNNTDNSNINVNLEKLNSLQLASLNIKETLESQISIIESGYEDMGYTDTNVKYQKITVDGKEFDGLILTAKIQGISFYAKIFAFRKGDYLANITMCSIQTDKTDTIASYFTVK